MMTLAEVNAVSPTEFALQFGDVVEHAPWVAEQAAGRRPFASLEAMIEAFEMAIHEAGEAEQLRLIRAHPDLGAGAAVAGDLSAESRKEQAGAGLGRLSPEELACFTELNRRYKARFGFPFILAVKGAGKHLILQSFALRLGNERDTERANALDQVCRIVGLRITERVAPCN